MPKEDDFALGAALNGFALDQMKGPLGGLGPPPPFPESRFIHPEMGLRSDGSGMHKVEGALTAPLGEGEVTLSGRAQKYGARDKPEFGATARYSRKF